MSSQLTSTSLITSLGSGSAQPIRKLTISLVVLTLGALTISSLLSRQIWESNLGISAPLIWILAVILVTSFFISSSVLSLVRISGISKGSDNLGRHLAILPVPPLTSWAIRLLPSFVLTMVIAIFCLPLSLAFAHAVTTSYLLSASFCLYGCFAGLCFVLWPIHHTLLRMTKPLILVGGTAIGVRLLSGELTFWHHISRETAPYLLISLLILPILGLIPSYLEKPGNYLPTSPSLILISLPKTTLQAFWYVLKILRNRSSLTDVSFLLIAALFLASTAERQSAIAGLEIIWITISMSAAGGLAGELRSLVPRHKAAEVFSLAGPFFLIRSQLRGSLVATSITCLPFILVLLHSGGWTPAHVIAIYLMSQLAACSLGIAVGSLVAPPPRDVGGQLLSVSFSATACYLLAKGAFYFSIPVMQLAILATSIPLTLLASHYIESLRIRSYGHI